MTSQTGGHKNRRRLFVLAVVLLAMAATTVAQATPVDTPQPGTADIANDGHELIAGTEFDLQIGVKASGVQPVTWIAITPGTDLTLLNDSTHSPHPLDGRNSGGWGVSSFTNNRVIFTGGKATPLQEEVFVLPLLVQSTAGAIQGIDKALDWKVETSFDNGAHKRQYAPTTPGELTSTIRVLQLLSGPAITLPAGATHGTVTQDQQVTVSSTVKNVGSQVLAINITYTAKNATVGSGSSQTLTQTLNPGDNAPLPVQATIGAAGNAATFTVKIGTASGDATIPPTDSASSTIQRPVVLTCGDVAPAESQTGASQSFQVAIQKTGDPSATISSASLTVSSNQPFTTPATTLNLPADDHTTDLSPLNFASVTTAGSDGKYGTRLNVTGSDANDDPLPTSIACTGQLRIDNQAPTVTFDPVQLPLLNLAGNTTIRQREVKNGDSINVSGKITEPGGCSGATLVGLILQINPRAWLHPFSFDTAGLTVLSDGTTCSFSGSIPPLTFDPDAAQFAVEIYATNPAGITGRGSTPWINIDNTPLSFAAKTLSAGTLHVEFNECVLGSSLPIDWNADPGDAFASVTPTPCKVVGSPFTIGGVDLTLAPTSSSGLPVGSFPEDATVHITYSQRIPDTLSSIVGIASMNLGYLNDAGNKLQSPTGADAIDGIPPQAPKWDSVEPGSGFQTNGGSDRRPTFHLSNLNPGDVVCLFIDTDGSGTVDANSTPLLKTCPAVADAANSIAVKIDTPLSGVDRTLTILAQVNDAGTSTVGSHALIFDTIGPVIANATIQSGGGSVYQLGIGQDATMTVNFDENLVNGANQADDWSLLDGAGTALLDVSVTGVSSCMNGDPHCVTLAIDARGTNDWTHVKKIRYAPASGTTAYQDNAGNFSPGSVASVAQVMPATVPAPESVIPPIHAAG